MTSAVVGVTVEPDGPGSLVVTWQVDGPDVAVDVSVGPTPEAIDHDHNVTVSAGVGYARLEGLPPGRHYVSVARAGAGPGVVAAERRVPFEGVTNFRDLGGYRTVEGRRTRWGMVFRADALNGLTSADLTAYDQLGLRVVYDLRGDVERAAFPNPMSSIQVPLLARVHELAAEEPVDRTGMTAREGEELLRDLYVGMLDHAGPLIGRVLTGLADPDGVPTVFHCAGGKDRTGITAAVLLELLGVSRADALDDYELTARFRRRQDQETGFQGLLDTGMPPEAAASVLGTPRWAMEEALQRLDGFGGVAGYLTGPGGMRTEHLDMLRRMLLTD